tara:strand:+ start:39422 stop:41134 length:1713 start_codon:yes stop_codon:yes gene_type:complete
VERNVKPWNLIYPRKYISPEFKVESWEDLEGYYSQLVDRQFSSQDELVDWLLQWSELHDVTDEFCTRRYIEMTCHTDSKIKREEYLYCVREIQPKVTKLADVLNRKYYDSPISKELDIEQYGQLNKIVGVSIELFEEKNIPIQIKLSELSQQYQEIMGAMTVNFEGSEKTFPEMSKYLRETDRNLRQKAFTAVTKRRMDDKDKLDDLFDEMVIHRTKFAQNLGMTGYREFCFRSKLRDYTPDDCMEFHKSIEKTAVPLAKKINAKRRKTMDLSALCPWDTEVDERGREPLKPFEKVDDLKRGVGEIFMSVDSRLGERYKSLLKSMDLDSRKGKAPGGYQTTLSESRTPFIFTNAVGSQNDVNTLLHECGHAFHTLQSRGLELTWCRHAAMEFCEVASMSQELICGEKLEPFYPYLEQQKRARTEHLRNLVGLFGWVAHVDAFQHWIYTNPEHSKKQRSDKWVELSERFDVGIDWSTISHEARASQWHKQLHIFEVPFYYIEYAIAQLGALQIYRNYKLDKDKAIIKYLEALSLGGAKPAKELFSIAGIKFDFSQELLGNLMDMVSAEIEM